MIGKRKGRSSRRRALGLVGRAGASKVGRARRRRGTQHARQKAMFGRACGKYALLNHKMRVLLVSTHRAGLKPMLTRRERPSAARASTGIFFWEESEGVLQAPTEI